jgi:PAS domain S-box-containing protein
MMVVAKREDSAREMAAGRKDREVPMTSEARLRLALASSGSGIWEWDVASGRIEWSPEMFDILGIDPTTSPKELYAAWQSVLHPADREESEAAANAAVAEGEPFSIDFRIFHRTRGERWVRAQAAVVRDEAGQPVRVAGINLDVTDQHRAADALRASEQRQRFLLALNDRLREIEDPLEVMTTASESLGRQLGIARVGYGEIDEAQVHVAVGRDWTDGSVASVAGRYRMRDFGAPIIDELMAGRTVRVDDVDADPRTRGAGAEAFRRISVRTVVAVPLMKDDRLTSMLFLQHPEPRTWSSEEMGLIQDVAQRTWHAVERSRAESQRRASEAELERITDALPVLVSFIDRDGFYRFANKAYETWYGRRPEDVVGRHVREVVGEEGYELRRPFIEAALEGQENRIEVAVPKPDGTMRLGDVHYLPRRDAGGRVDGFHAFVVDVTERTQAQRALERLNETLEAEIEARTRDLRTAEHALRQSQKMEAIGQLTGGIAHDFNNLLQVIGGGLDLLDRSSDPQRLARLKEGMRQAAARGADLTRQLLSFSRRQSLRPQPVDLALRLKGMKALLDRSLRGDVRVEVDLPPDLWPIRADPAELELCILNIAVNARDAMPSGGTIRISAQNRPALRRPPLQGDFVRLALADSGVGMTAEIADRVFEPFFTTKELGKGTGLGLSQVYGFTQQSGGTVEIETSEGLGTTVVLLLPRANAPAAAGVEASPRPTTDLGLRLLLVEDDDDVAELVTAMARDLGCEVTRARGGQEALAILAESEVEIVFSDIMMPVGSGVELARELQRSRPSLPVVLTTGDPASGRGAAPSMTVLPKPFSAEQLAAALANAYSAGKSRRARPGGNS